VYVALPSGAIPPWAIALMVLGGLILATLLALLLHRRGVARVARTGR
jgi:hypothetical protein